MAILLDSSAVIAAADTADLNHAAALAWFRRADEPLHLGALTLGEIDVVLQRDLDATASLSVVEAIVGGSIRLVAPTEDDRPRLADALLVATAERLRIHRVATFERRPIAILTPRHVRALDLEP